MEAWREELYGGELYHHGILGMRWGERNGPPYPLSRLKNSNSKTKQKRYASIREEWAANRKKKAAEQTKKAAQKKRQATLDAKKKETENAEKAETKRKEYLEKTKNMQLTAEQQRRRAQMMTDAELKSEIDRKRQEAEYLKLTGTSAEEGRGFLSKFMDQAIKPAAIEAGKQALKQWLLLKVQERTGIRLVATVDDKKNTEQKAASNNSSNTNQTESKKSKNQNDQKQNDQKQKIDLSNQKAIMLDSTPKKEEPKREVSRTEKVPEQLPSDNTPKEKTSTSSYTQHEPDQPRVLDATKMNVIEQRIALLDGYKLDFTGKEPDPYKQNAIERRIQATDPEHGFEAKTITNSPWYAKMENTKLDDLEDYLDSAEWIERWGKSRLY